MKWDRKKGQAALNVLQCFHHKNRTEGAAMSHTHSTTTTRSYKHLDPYRRGQIFALLSTGMSKTDIAKQVKISRSTLYREITRGTVTQMRSDLTTYQKYFPDTTQKNYEANRRASRKPYKIQKAHEFLCHLQEQFFQQHMSIDAICSRTARDRLFDTPVCTKTVYNYIAQGLLPIKNIDLPQRVRRKNTTKQERTGEPRFGQSIELRPDSVDSREEFGHFEIDSILGKQGTDSALLALDERSSRKRFLLPLAEKTSACVNEAIQRLKDSLGKHFSLIFKSVTSDNGSEFSKLQEVFGDIPVYYAHPYTPSERGTNERQNGMVRRFIPKGTDIACLTPDTIQQVEDWMNNLPRKILGYDTPKERFDSYVAQFAAS